MTSFPISQEPIHPLKVVSVLGYHHLFLSSVTERRDVGASLGVFVVLVFMERGGQVADASLQGSGDSDFFSKHSFSSL